MTIEETAYDVMVVAIIASLLILLLLFDSFVICLAMAPAMVWKNGVTSIISDPIPALNADPPSE